MEWYYFVVPVVVVAVVKLVTVVKWVAYEVVLKFLGFVFGAKGDVYHYMIWTDVHLMLLKQFA